MCHDLVYFVLLVTIVLLTSVPLGPCPVPGDPAGWKKASKNWKWAEPDQIYDLRVDMMQRQKEAMCKTIECVPQHPDAVSLAASGNLDKTSSSGCGSSGQVDIYDGEDKIDTDSQVGRDCPESAIRFGHLQRSWTQPRKGCTPLCTGVKLSVFPSPLPRVH